MFRILMTMLLSAAVAVAQTAPPPAPQEDYSGLYEFVREGETLQLSVEGERLTGFVSRLPEDERGPVLDHFFKEAKIAGDKVSFTTKTVHGVWFEFRGAMERGAGKTRADEGYYVLHGSLTQHTGDARNRVTAKSREVWFKSFPRLDDEPPK